MPPFDVLNTIDRTLHPFLSGRARLTIKSVNLMSFLLEGITYNQLYALNFKPVLKQLISKAAELDHSTNAILNKGAYDDSVRIRPWLVKTGSETQNGALDDILAVVSDDFKLGSIFTDDLPPGSVGAQVAQRLTLMYTNSFVNSNTACELDHFCCPFLYYYQQPSGQKLDPAYLTDFLVHLGDKSMGNLFKDKKVDYENEGRLDAIRNAKIRKILVDRSLRVTPTSPIATSDSTELTFATFPPGNGLICSGGRCISSDDPDDWCNTATGGGCSAASNP